MRMIAQGYSCEGEDFLGYDMQTAANETWEENTNTGGTFTTQTNHNGLLRLAMGSAETAGGSACGSVQYRPDRTGGPLILEARFRTSDVSVASVFVGFTDSNSDTVVIENEDGTLNTVPTDACGVLLEGEESLMWHAISVNGDNDGELEEIPGQEEDADSRWHIARVEVSPEGHAIMSIDGKYALRRLNAVSPDVEYTWVFAADGRGTAYNVELDYFEVTMPRSN